MAHKAKPKDDTPPVVRQDRPAAGWWHDRHGLKSFDELIAEVQKYAPSNQNRRRQIMDGWKLVHHGIESGVRHVLYVDLGNEHYQILDIDA